MSKSVVNKNLLQAVRVLDVLVIGPIIIKVANEPGRKPLEKVFLNAVGIGTIVFNGIRFFEDAK